ncbi:hypothetical protein FQN54_007538 [Arachnomyces sp. PD_36]|nr:hypothetical protein FQN54_007538 [Arachnomyces sp. PD_36]
MKANALSLTTYVAGPSGAWERAVKDYIGSLPPAQQQAAKAPATVDECIQILITQSSRKKAFTRVLDAFRPIIDPLKRFEGAIDVLVQTSSGIASPIWGPVRMAITVASQHFSTLEQLAFVLEKITGCVQRYGDLETLFTSHDAVRDAIGALYADLIRLCTHVVKFYSSRIKFLVVPFEREFGNIVQSIDLHSAEADLAAASAHMKEAKEARARVMEESQVQTIRRLQCWLSPPVMEDGFERHWAEYFPQSLDWFPHSPEFQDWGSSRSGQILEVTGPPGSGKSVLSAFVINHLRRESPGSPVLYYFCGETGTEDRSLFYIERTLLAQLLRSDPTTAASILPFYQQSYSDVINSHSLAEGALLEALRNRRSISDPIYIIVDSIDETILPGDWTEYHRFSDFCENLMGIEGVKLIVTRRYPTGDCWLKGLTRRISINVNNSAQFIEKYVGQRVQGTPHLANSDLGNKVHHGITERANGLWLYARLMTDEVIRAPSSDLVEKYLQTLPNNLSELYTQILRTREALMTQDEKRFATALFLWIDVGSFLPTFLSSRYEPLVGSVLQLIFRRVNGGNEVFDAVALAERLGAPLLQIRQTASSHELGFTHQSAYQYLSEFGETKHAENLPEILRPQPLRALHRGVTAIWYFTECEDCAKNYQELKESSSTSRWLFTSDSYFEMAYSLWAVLSSSTEWSPPLASDDSVAVTEGEPMLQQIAEFLDSRKCLQWVEMATIINYSGNFQELFENILSALHCEDNSPPPELEWFNIKCRTFLEDWGYVIQTTTGWSDHNKGIILPKPPGFDDRELAMEMLRMGQEWSETCRTSLSTQYDSDLISKNWTRCPQCMTCLPKSVNMKSHRYNHCWGVRGLKRTRRRPMDLWQEDTLEVDD